VSGFYRHDVQVPTLAAIFSQVPGLQDALDRAGIVASTPEQLAELPAQHRAAAITGIHQRIHRKPGSVA